jgi:inorganic pyrophosphatase
MSSAPGLQQMDRPFWTHLDQLAATSRIVIDRPKGSAHPRYPDMIYPVDYGYLDGTTTVDGGGIDVWVGSTGATRPNAIICTVDLLKHDAEIKVLIGCSGDEQQVIVDFLNTNAMRALLIRRGKS